MEGAGLKLYVDDLRKEPAGWHLARTVTEAIRILSMGRVVHASLDHDISHSVQVGAVARPYPCEETFEPVAHYIALMSMVPNVAVPRVTIHTANPAGALRMKGILADKGIEACIVLGKPVNGLEA